MTILTHDCPRCGANNTAFTLLAEHRVWSTDEIWGVFACPKCDRPLAAKIRYGSSLNGLRGDIRDSPAHILNVEPPSPTPSAPAHTPNAIAEFYTEACDSLQRGKWTSAAGMLRKCMEVALKEFAPDVEAWKLEKRIDKLAAENRITPALKDWAHELRLDGNDALHGTAPATEDLATRMERLTHFLLVYLYTLPAQVAQARSDRENGK